MITALARFWCRHTHGRTTRPINHSYTCWQCLRRWDVPWDPPKDQPAMETRREVLKEETA